MKKNWYSKRAMLLLQEIENLLPELPIALGDLVQKPVVRIIMKESGEVVAEETIDRRVRETVKELRGKGRGKKALIQIERILAIPPSIRIKNLTPFGHNLLKAVRDTEWWQNGLNSSSKNEKHSKDTITVYRDNIVEFLSQLVENNKLDPSVREKAEEIATAFFKEKPFAKNVVLIQTKCPICNSESFAIQTYNEEKMTVLPEVYEMNASTLLKKALQLTFTNINFLVPIILVCLFEIFVRMYKYETEKLYYLAGINTGEKLYLFPKLESLYAFNPLLLLVDLLEWLFILLAILWILVCLKELEDNPDHSIDMQKSLKKGIQFFPRLFVVFFLSILISIIYTVIGDFLSQRNDGLWQFVSLPIDLGIIIGSFLLLYFGAVIVFENVGILEGIEKSAVFANEHKGTTLGVLIASVFISFALMFPLIIISILMEDILGFSTDIILLNTSYLTITFNWVNTIFMAAVSTFQIIYLFVAYGWAYGKFTSRKSK